MNVRIPEAWDYCEIGCIYIVTIRRLTIWHNLLNSIVDDGDIDVLLNVLARTIPQLSDMDDGTTGRLIAMIVELVNWNILCFAPVTPDLFQCSIVQV
ncbi:hypothetical protein C497_02237 [Halalkalicoccus jeotgali B3]|uniref:Uncharacterized protein n=1 Tax=Halalkalicoccus jeotgali (strain DSM 18796 / CECT 7217 / JCM 14584 / KCTC 4019 / B3) TaxID=795797 RepID=L9VUK8_HALJB|nr:hypothetical protein C497_02237 [Halalkalicoccus jeotgali B3]